MRTWQLQRLIRLKAQSAREIVPYINALTVWLQYAYA